MSYWIYYLAIPVLAYVLHRPWLLLGIGVFLLLRRWLPEPAVLFGTLRRMRNLEAQVRANPQNVSARRDLARIYLEQLRPGRAISLLDEALTRTPDDAELLYLKGVALHRKGRHEDALAPLVAAVTHDSRVAFGEPYATAGDALVALGKLAEAEDAYGRYLDHNSSAVAVRIRLAKVMLRRGERENAKREVAEALATYHDLPAYARRRHFRGWLDAQLARATVAREPVALGIAALTMALLALATWRIGRRVDSDLRDRHGFLPQSFGMRWLVPPAPPATRFTRVALPQGATVRPVRIRGMSGDVAEMARGVPPTFDVERSRPGDLACRMNAAFGPGDATDWGVAWALRDTSTGAVVTARVTIGTSDYGALSTSVGPTPTAAIDALEAYVDEAPQVDCEIAVRQGKMSATIGVRGGAAFVLPAAGTGDDVGEDP